LLRQDDLSILEIDERARRAKKQRGARLGKPQVIVYDQPGGLPSMEDLHPVENKIFRYPVFYRSLAWLSVAVFGLIVLGCALAAVVAIRRDGAAVALYVFGFSSGIAVIFWGLDFATRSITISSGGLQVRWLLRRSVVPWPDVLGWRYRALSLIHIRVRHGSGLFIWPLLENYTDLLNEIDAQRRATLRAEVLIK
jgi:hypothetical protein